jgi:hypothetical protein
MKFTFRLMVAILLLSLTTIAARAASCSATAGAAKAKIYSGECLSISLNPSLCDVKNSCAIIIQEIKRSCGAYIPPLPAPAFCKKYM